MKNILLPTDFSNNSYNAIKYAVELFKDEDCTFHLFNVFKIPYMPNEHLSENDARELAMMDTDLYEKSKKGLDEILRKIDEGSKLNFKLHSIHNSLIDAILQLIDKEDIDLIVMGTKGATGAKEIFIGSNTGDVLEKTEIDLLVIPDETEIKEIKEITFPTDFRIHYKREDLENLILLVEKTGSNIRILYVKDRANLSEDQEKNKESLEMIFKDIKYTFHEVTGSDFEAAINTFTRSRENIDMIAILARHHNLFQRIFFTPRSEKLCFHSKIPLMVLHTDE